MSERYQREIEEILNQAGESVPADGSKKDRGVPLIPPFFRKGRGTGGRVRFSSGRLMFIGLALLLSAILVSAMFPGLLGPIVWLSLIMFILGYVLFFARPSSGPEKRWRGRVIEQDRSSGMGSGWFSGLQRWFKRR